MQRLGVARVLTPLILSVLGLPLAVGFLFVGAEPADAIDKPAATWAPCARDNFTRGRRARISMVVIHTIEGSAQSGLNTFRNPSTNVSAHYVVAKDGRLFQVVGDGDTAWHAGGVNSKSIGIEHEGFCDHADMWTMPMLQASARLTRWLCDTYSIPIDRQHIIGHVEAPGSRHHDPGRHFDWDLYLRLVRGAGEDAPPIAEAPGLPLPNLGGAPTSPSTTPPGATTPSTTGPNGPGQPLGLPNARRPDGLAGRIGSVSRAEDTSTPDAPLFAREEEPELQRGSRGRHVKKLQELLVAAGHPIKVDGIFGPETEGAVRDYQKAHDLGRDGIVGEQTWGSLLGRKPRPTPTTTTTTSP